MAKPPVLILWLSKGFSGINICPLNKEPPDINHLQPVQDINWKPQWVKWILFPPIRWDFFIVCIYLKVRHLASLQGQRENCIAQEWLIPFTQKQHQSLQPEAKLSDKWNALRQPLSSTFKLTPRYPKKTKSERWAKLQSPAHTQVLVLMLARTWLGASGGMGDGDLDWKASWDMNPESWEDTLDSLMGACWGRLELR